MKCPRCKAKTERVNEIEGPFFVVKTRACPTIGCPLYRGFHTIEAVTSDEVFRGILEKAEREALADRLPRVEPNYGAELEQQLWPKAGESTAVQASRVVAPRSEEGEVAAPSIATASRVHDDG